MLSDPPGARFVSGHLMGPALQQFWDVPHAVWFTLMGVGGGVFLLARLLRLELELGAWLGLPAIDLISFVVIGVGGLVLIGHLGRPLRFLRAVARPGTSWISRGAIADFVFFIFGGLLIVPGLRVGAWAPFAGLPWDVSGNGAVGRVMLGLALLSAVVVIYYAGQVLADGKAIPYWGSLAVPLQFTLSSLAASLSIVMTLELVHDRPIDALQCGLLAAFLALLLVCVGWHVRPGARPPGKAEAVAELLQGRYRASFVGGVLIAGTAVPAVLAALAIAVPALRPTAAVIALFTTVPAGYALRLLTLRVGYFAPISARLRLRRA